MMTTLFATVSMIAGGIGALIGRYSKIRKARKEIQDVITLAEKMSEKYGDLDDDAKAMRREINEAIYAVKMVFKF